MKLKFKTNKKGISTVIVTVLLVALTIVVVGIVWVVIDSLIRGKMAGTEACFGNFGKVSINNQYTCYDGTTDYFDFSISIGDINVESAIISISSAGETKSFTITNTETEIANLGKYPIPIFGTDLIKLPEKNGGKTYITDSFTTKPDSIKIAPVINKQQCEVSDTLVEIDDC